MLLTDAYSQSIIRGVAPRTYKLGKRADTTEATRQRILDATIDLYRTHGVAATTLKAIAGAADVSRGTILNHFGSADGLLGAVLDHVVATLELPDPRIYEGLSSRDDRIRAFVHASFDFQERSEHWWSMFEQEMHRPELQQREAGYWAELATMQAAALGPDLGDDPAANAVLVSVIHPATAGTFAWAFEQAGLPRGDARTLLADLAVDAVRRIADRKLGEGGLQ
ncbi:MAG: TetR/AcrR family transcriptional regulator [Chloroflexi bacterium]|nr:TetR/AcrR family transcriptional regulator [Chloroflexota bacterium]